MQGTHNTDKNADCYVIPILTDVSECWTISTSMERRIQAAEMWFLRQMLGIPWRSHTPNENALKKANSEHNKENTINRQEKTVLFAGHMKGEGLEELFLEEKSKEAETEEDNA